MTERERLAADARLCAWLAEARLGPVLTSVSPLGRATAAERRPWWPRRLVHGGLAALRALGQEIRLPQPGGTRQIAGSAGSVSRRGSLATFGGAALATALGGSQAVTARKRKNDAKKKCRKQVAPCRELLALHCESDRAPCAQLFACCESLADCKAKRAMDCMFAWFAAIDV
jgi:hypothetical protein